LYKALSEAKWDEYKFLAAIHGINLDDEKNSSCNKGISSNKEESSLLFKSPEEYKEMTDEERDRLTQKMMSYFKTQAAVSPAAKSLG